MEQELKGKVKLLKKRLREEEVCHDNTLRLARRVQEREQELIFQRDRALSHLRLMVEMEDAQLPLDCPLRVMLVNEAKQLLESLKK